MIKLKQTTDYEYIYHCLTLPHVWRNSIDHTCPSKEFYFPPINDDWIYLKVSDYGLFCANRIDNDTWEAHIALDKNAYGKAIELAQESMQWFFKNMNASLMVNARNKFIKRMVEILYFKKIGHNQYFMDKEIYLCHRL